MVTKNGLKLADVIKKAIEDHMVTNAEYEIYNIALGRKDRQHEKALSPSKNMIADKTIKRVP